MERTDWREFYEIGDLDRSVSKFIKIINNTFYKSPTKGLMRSNNDNARNKSNTSLLKIINNYLEKHRSLQIYENIDLEVTAGVLQDSILVPPLWKILYNEVLDEVVPDGVTTIANADDFELIITPKTMERLKWDTAVNRQERT
ncbi:hypothetical protein JTB14_005275 [Gonioctena quinquepunctata]|nr:hypothetical protein JTB14_005275 [Gonioctena quinquepunctata]